MIKKFKEFINEGLNNDDNCLSQVEKFIKRKMNPHARQIQRSQLQRFPQPSSASKSSIYIHFDMGGNFNLEYFINLGMKIKSIGEKNGLDVYYTIWGENALPMQPIESETNMANTFNDCEDDNSFGSTSLVRCLINSFEIVEQDKESIHLIISDGFLDSGDFEKEFINRFGNSYKRVLDKTCWLLCGGKINDINNHQLCSVIDID